MCLIHREDRARKRMTIPGCRLLSLCCPDEKLMKIRKTHAACTRRRETGDALTKEKKDCVKRKTKGNEKLEKMERMGRSSVSQLRAGEEVEEEGPSPSWGSKEEEEKRRKPREKG
jgi:hypothetical protein